MKLIRKQIYLTQFQDRAVKRLAQEQGTTEAEIFHKALDIFLAKENMGENPDPFEGLIGLLAGPLEIDHDDIYR